MAYRSVCCIMEIYVLIFLILTGPTLPCGPGRQRGNSRRHRKMTPLVFKQHVPNVSENTLGASGLAEGALERDDPGFKDLVVNYNPDIIFKDEEGTGADRIMTQRCKDKLNTLAIAVMNRWQGVKLRVTEAWDENGNHAKDSLHYEGRAVDITTSDRDRTKYGMLARLAVEAGFDWVYYESRSHIHCSVKSDSSIAIKTGGCFHGDGVVSLSDGQTIPLSQLAVGDHVMTIDQSGQLVQSQVIMFMDVNVERRMVFYRISTEDGRNITLTPGHIIYTSSVPLDNPSDGKQSFAKEVSVGDYVYIGISDSNDVIRASQITEVTPVTSVGAYAPVTLHGTIIVNDIYASCYAMITQEWIAHASFAPVRMYTHMSNILGDTSSLDRNLPTSGLHWYVNILHDIGQYVIRKDLWFHP